MELITLVLLSLSEISILGPSDADDIVSSTQVVMGEGELLRCSSPIGNGETFSVSLPRSSQVDGLDDLRTARDNSNDAHQLTCDMLMSKFVQDNIDRWTAASSYHWR